MGSPSSPSDPYKGIAGLSLSFDKLNVSHLLRLFRRPGGELMLNPPKDGAKSRFDDSRSPAQFAITYAATDVKTTLFESKGIRESGGILLVQGAFHRAALVARYQAERALNILPLTEGNVAKLNATDVVRDADYPRCQRLAQGIHDWLPDVDAILYISRMYPPHTCVAIFDRGVRACKLRARTMGFLRDEKAYRDGLRDGDFVLAPIDLGRPLPIEFTTTSAKEVTHTERS